MYEITAAEKNFIHTIVSSANKKISKQELIALHKEKGIFQNIFVCETFKLLIDQKNHTELDFFVRFLKEDYADYRGILLKLTESSDNFKEVYASFKIIVDLPVKVVADEKIFSALLKHKEHLASLAEGLRTLYFFQLRLHKLYYTDAAVLFLNPKKAAYMAKMCVILFDKFPDLYAKLGTTERKAALLYPMYILYMEVVERDAKLFRHYINFLFANIPRSLYIAKGLHALKIHDVFVDDIVSLLVQTPENFSRYLFFIMTLKKDTQNYQGFLQLKFQQKIQLLNTFQTLEDAGVYNFKYHLLLLKHLDHMDRIYQGLIILHDANLLHPAAAKMLAKDPKHAKENAADYVKFRLFLLEINLAGEARLIPIPRLLTPTLYCEELRLNVGKATLKHFIKSSLAIFVPDALALRLGDYFFNKINGYADVLENNILESLTYIVNHGFYQDPDRFAPELDMPHLKKICEEKLNELFFNLSEPKEFYKIMRIMGNAVNVILPPHNTLDHWRQEYVKLVAKFDTFQIKTPLPSLVWYIPEYHPFFISYTYATLKFKPFCEIKPAELLTLAQIIVKTDLLSAEIKKNSVRSIQRALMKKEEGVFLLKGLFNSYKKSVQEPSFSQVAYKKS